MGEKEDTECFNRASRNIILRVAAPRCSDCRYANSARFTMAKLNLAACGQIKTKSTSFMLKIGVLLYNEFQICHSSIRALRHWQPTCGNLTNPTPWVTVSRCRDREQKPIAAHALLAPFPRCRRRRRPSRRTPQKWHLKVPQYRLIISGKFLNHLLFLPHEKLPLFVIIKHQFGLSENLLYRQLRKLSVPSSCILAVRNNGQHFPRTRSHHNFVSYSTGRRFDLTFDSPFHEHHMLALVQYTQW